MKYILTVLAVGVLLSPSFVFADFDTNLKYGSSGQSVTELQDFLTSQGVYSGPITGHFYSLTLAGVKAYQAKSGITPVSGFWGPITRGVAQKDLAQSLESSTVAEAAEVPVGTVPVVVPPSPTPQPPVSTEWVVSSFGYEGQQADDFLYRGNKDLDILSMNANLCVSKDDCTTVANRSQPNGEPSRLVSRQVDNGNYLIRFGNSIQQVGYSNGSITDKYFQITLVSSSGEKKVYEYSMSFHGDVLTLINSY